MSLRVAPESVVLIEARKWLSGPGEHYIALSGKGLEDFAHDLVEDLYLAGAQSIYVHNPGFDEIYKASFAEELWINSTPYKEGDVLISLSKFHPDEITRVNNKTHNRRTVRAWWD